MNSAKKQETNIHMISELYFKLFLDHLCIDSKAISIKSFNLVYQFQSSWTINEFLRTLSVSFYVRTFL